MTFDDWLTLFLVLYIIGIFALLVYWEWAYSIHRVLRTLFKKEDDNGQER